jgi:RNA ligase (TIGR02306 family)
MSNWTPIVIRLTKIARHPNAETLEISQVLGDHTVIFKENQYKEGDLVSFIPYDTVCSDNPIFDFLGDKKRIKPCRLRGIFSEAILVPAPPNSQEGDSVVEYYGLKKYEYEEEMAARIEADTEKAPNHFQLPHYDLESLRKYIDRFEDGEQVVINEKLEGENCCIIYDGERLYVRSRHLFKVEKPESHWWEPALRDDLKTKLTKYPMLGMFCELYGRVKHFAYDAAPKKGGGYEGKIRIFDIWDTQSFKFLEWDEVKRICADVGIEAVPELYVGEWKADKSLYALAEGKSTIGTCVKEGFVMRSAPNAFDPYINGRKIVKLKSQDYQIFKARKS